MELKYWDSMKYLEEQLDKAKRVLPTPDADATADAVAPVTAETVVTEAAEPVVEAAPEDVQPTQTNMHRRKYPHPERVETVIASFDAGLAARQGSEVAAADSYQADEDEDDYEEQPQKSRKHKPAQKTVDDEVTEAGFSGAQFAIMIFVGIPIGIPLLLASLAVFSAVTFALAITAIALGVTSVGGLIGGVAAVVYGLISIFSSIGVGVMILAISMFMICIGALAAVPARLIILKAIPFMVSAVTTVWGKIIGVFI